MRTRSSSHLLLLVVIVGVLLWSSADVASASSWVPTIAAGSTGEAHAQAQPSAPTGVSAVCTSSAGKTIKVTWSAVSHATSYSIYKSTTSASSGFTPTAS